MSYVVKCDNDILYNKYIDERYLLDSELDQVDNEAGSFIFEIDDAHPLYNSIVMKKSRIKIYKDGKLKWLGRPIEMNEEIDGSHKYYCEGCLGYLNDSILRPFDFTGSPSDFFSLVIGNHNSEVADDQKFIIGECTVTDPNDYIVRSSEFYNKTSKIVSEKMLNLGGHLVITFDQNEKPILSWLSTISDISTQHIKLGQNLVSYERSLLYSEFYTACIPLGVRYEDGTRLTIASENDGKDYLVNSTLANIYGIIYADPDVTTWEDVTVAANLKTKGTNWLNNVGVKYKKVINLEAEDISFLMQNAPNAEFDFMLNVIFDTVSESNVTYLISKFGLDIRDECSLRIVLSETSAEYVESSLSKFNQRAQSATVQRIEAIEADYITEQDASNIADERISQSTLIEQKANAIILSALQEYTKTSDFNTFSSSVLTQLSALAGEVDIDFRDVQTSISNLAGQTASQFSDIHSFIRFLAYIQGEQNEGIVIGISTSDIKLKLEHDILYFFTGDEKLASRENAIAWFESNQLYVNNTTIQNLTLGTTGAYLDARIVGSGDNICVLWSGRLS